MTEDISNYTFDFEKEARQLRRSLPSKGKNVLIAETDVTQPDGPGTPVQVDVRHMIGNQKTKDIHAIDFQEWIEMTYRKEPNSSSTVVAPPGENLYGLSIRKEEKFIYLLGEENKEMMRLFMLYHETGHVMLPDGPVVDNDHPFKECSADAYAALRILQRFGREAEPFLSMVSWQRTLNAIIGDPSHLTTAVFDRIIADSAMQDFTQLTPAQITKLAKKYAEDGTPEDAIFTEAKDLFVHGPKINFPRLAETCLSSSNQFAFYIGAKFFQPFLEPQGVILNGRQMALTDGNRQEYAGLIEAGSISAAFSDKAARPLAALLKVSRPRGQKQFVVSI